MPGYVLQRVWTFDITPSNWSPNIDVFECQDALVIRMEIAGMAEEDFSIVQRDGKLSIDGIRHDPMEKESYQLMEIPFGNFHVDVELHNPGSLNLDQMAASYKNGFLLIRCPLKEGRKISLPRNSNQNGRDND